MRFKHIQTSRTALMVLEARELNSERPRSSPEALMAVLEFGTPANNHPSSVLNHQNQRPSSQTAGLSASETAATQRTDASQQVTITVMSSCST